jgi:gamma-glutamylcyclotransferase (GGCT)/AIG2-like uncharacterized protein YtfP
MKNNTVAVYGSLRKGFGNHALLRDAEFVTEEYISGYDMISLGGFPALFKSEVPVSKILVEIYKVDDSEMTGLDRLEGYPSFYNREEIETSKGKAWIYFIENSSGYYESTKNREVIKSGDWKEYNNR